MEYRYQRKGWSPVIGLNAKSMDVVWDMPFMSGVTLGDWYGLFTTHGRDLAKIDSITAVLNTAARLQSSPLA